MRLRLALMLAVIMLPLVMALAQLAVRHQATLLDLSPAPYPNGNISDSLYYWHQASSFAAHGTQSGYYTVNEQPATAAYSPYYTWGIFVPAFYGVFGTLFGWYPASIPLINLLLLTLALAAFMLLRPTVPQLLLIGGFLITSNAFHIQYASSMTTLLHLALAVLLACFVVRLLNGQRAGSSLTALVLILLFATLLLPPWGLLFVFVGAYAARRSMRGIILGALIGALVFGILTLFVQSTGAPFPHLLTDFVEAARRSIGDVIQAVIANMGANLRYTLQGSIVEIISRLQVLVFAFAAAVAWLVSRRKSASLSAWQWELAFHALNLGSIYGLTFVLHEQAAGRDYRLFAPRLLLSALVLVGMRRYRIAAVALLTMAIAAPFALYDGGAWAEAHISRDNNAYLREQQAQFAEVMPYAQDAPSRWCNTVLMSFYYVATRPAVPMAVPAGVGLSWGVPSGDAPPARSRYLLLVNEDYETYPDSDSLAPLLTVPDGTLYVNSAADC